MSRILNRQRQLAESGRLRLGFTDSTGARPRPVRSETWILTSHSREIVTAAADQWGGTPEQWQPLGNGAQQWRVITAAAAIDAILPPGDPLTQAYETWSRGGCQRRCDGVTEQLSGSPCLCAAQFGDAWYEQPKGKVCDTKTRLKVLLPDLPGLGSYRVETGSYYAADEIAGMVDVLRGAVGDAVMLPVRLRIEPRTRVANGQTKQFVVPVLELRGHTAREVLEAGAAGVGLGIGAAPQRAQIGAAPDTATADEQADEITRRAAACATGEDLTALWQALAQEGQAGKLLVDRDRVTDILKTRAAQIDGTTSPAADNEPVDAEIVHDDDEPDRGEAWMTCVALAGRIGWTTEQLEDDFAGIHNGDMPSEATAAQLVAYAARLRALPKGAAA